MRPDSPEWRVAKAEGDRAELAVAEWFRGRGFQTYKALGRTDFDLLLQCAVEVKHDLKAPQTGKVAIEVKHRSQLSGIMSTTASYWALVIGNQVFIVQTARLRDLALRSTCPEVPAGDDKASLVRLVPLDKLRHMQGIKVVELPELQG